MDSDIINLFALNKSALPILEEILEQENKKLQAISLLKTKKNPDFRGVLSQHSIEHTLFPDVCQRVNNFLDAREINPPSLQYYRYFPQTDAFDLAGRYALAGFLLPGIISIAGFVPQWVSLSLFGSFFAMLILTLSLHKSKIEAGNLYLPDNQAIQLRRKYKASVFGTLCHEYTHHVQGVFNPELYKGARSPATEIIIEGHARGVTRNMCINYALEQDDPSFLYFDQNLLAGELKSVYQWMCKDRGITPKKRLLATKTFVDANEKVARYSFGIPSQHAIGNFLFYFMEKTLGSDIYKSFLRTNNLMACGH